MLHFFITCRIIAFSEYCPLLRQVKIQKFTVYTDTITLVYLSDLNLLAIENLFVQLNIGSPDGKSSS